MKLSDCEIEHRYVRNTRLSFIFGARALNAGELKALMVEYTDVYGPVKLPAYVSPDGWQVYEPEPEPAVAADAEPPVEAPPAAAPAPSGKTSRSAKG